MPEIVEALAGDGSEFSDACLKRIAGNSPLSMACALKLIRMQRDSPTLGQALALEYRYVHRSVEHTDFIEGIRALVIDKDNSPQWRHAAPDCVDASEVDTLLSPLGNLELSLEEER